MTKYSLHKQYEWYSRHDTIGTSGIEFLCRSKQRWHVREQMWLWATLVDSMCIEELEEDEDEE
jgi:hypothetical protein